MAPSTRREPPFARQTSVQRRVGLGISLAACVIFTSLTSTWTPSAVPRQKLRYPSPKSGLGRFARPTVVAMIPGPWRPPGPSERPS
eukprot:1395390-Amorphochlora_amoeboformis.AAC.2